MPRFLLLVVLISLFLIFGPAISYQYEDSSKLDSLQTNYSEESSGYDIKYYPRPIPLRTDRINIIAGFKHYHGGFNPWLDAYAYTVVATGYPFFVLAVAQLIIFGVICIFFAHKFAPRNDVKDWQIFLNQVGKSLVALSILAMACMLMFIIAQAKFYDKSSNILHRFLTEPNEVINARINNAVLPTLQSAIDELTDDIYVNHDPNQPYNTRRSLLHYLYNAQEALSINYPWKKEAIHLQNLSLMQTQIILSSVFLILTFILVVIVLIMSSVRLYNPYFMWPRAPVFKYLVYVGLTLVVGIFFSAGYSFAMSTAVNDAFQAATDYGPPFNTLFDWRNFTPCAKLQQGTHAVLEQYREFNDYLNDGIYIYTYGNTNTPNNSTKEPIQLTWAIFNATEYLEDTLSDLQRLGQCSDLFDTLRPILRSRKPIQQAGQVMWISLILLAIIIDVLSILTGVARSINDPPPRSPPQVADKEPGSPPHVDTESQDPS